MNTAGEGWIECGFLSGDVQCMVELTVWCGRPGMMWYTSGFPSLCGIAQIINSIQFTASHCKKSAPDKEKKPNLSSLTNVSVQWQDSTGYSFISNPLLNNRISRWNKDGRVYEAEKCFYIVNPECNLLYHLSSVVVSSLPLGVKQLTSRLDPPHTNEG